MPVLSKGDGELVIYHLHSDDSLLDSATDFSEYVELAKAQGMTAIGSTEHGIHRNWAKKKMMCDEAGLKFLCGAEIYLTEQLEPKVKDNYHTVLIAKNAEGLRELHRIVLISTRDDHTYYKNRISFDEFLRISDNVIKISACVQSPLCKLPEDHPRYMELARHYDWLEIQHHNMPSQRNYNLRLLDLSRKTGIPLIAGTDTHSSNEYKKRCRDILMRYKHQHYEDEDACDLTWKTEEELIKAYEAQGVLPRSVYMEAIHQTDVMAASVEDIPLDTDIKYPILYGTREADAKKFEERIEEMFVQKLEQGVIPLEEEESFRESMAEEIRVFQKLHMDGFMLSMSELLSWCHKEGIYTGPARGSVGGSRVAYVLGIIDMNPEELHTVFSRFANEDRVEVGDIDTDCITSERPRIFEYITKRFGAAYVARVGSYGTLADLAIIDVVGGALAEEWSMAHEDADPARNPYSLQKIKGIKAKWKADPDAARAAYPEIFTYYDGLRGVKTSQSVHPAGMVISPVMITDQYGLMHKDGELCLLFDMDTTHDVGLVKYDFLGLKTLSVIQDTCKYAKYPMPKYHTLDWKDQDVWRDITADPISIFQFESKFAADALKRFKPHSLEDLSLVTACIRPSGASYREKVFEHIPNTNPTPEMDEVFKDSLGYCVYQEQIIQALITLCGFSGGQADTIRRAIASKKPEKIEAAIPKIRDGYCSVSTKPREVAEKEVSDFLQVIQDASGYSFGYNHSIGYCLVSYICGWLRYYFPCEYIAAYLNNADNDADLDTGRALAKRYHIDVLPPKFGLAKSSFQPYPDKKQIIQGLQAIKGCGISHGDALYELSQNKYDCFIDLLIDIKTKTKINSTLLQSLIDIDFFSDFGNQTELTSIMSFYEKYAGKKTLKKAEYEKSPLLSIIRRNSTGLTKAGKEAATWTITNPLGFLHGLEDFVRSRNMPGPSVMTKALNYRRVMGFLGFISGRDEDRPVLYVRACYPLKRKRDGILFGYSIQTVSLGSGIESRFTIFKEVYDLDPIKEDDFIRCHSWKPDRGYYVMTAYEKLYIEP